MPERYPGYDVLAKRDTLSWNAATRQVIDARLALPDSPEFFRAEEWQILLAVCARIVPQPAGRLPVPIAALVDRKLVRDARDGYRLAALPGMQEAWRRGLAALQAETRGKHGQSFEDLAPGPQDELLQAMQNGELVGPEWGGMPSAAFFSARLARDIVAAYYSHPSAWNEIGFGGPASPRGYVRMYFNRRDPWEAAEAKPGEEGKARKVNRTVGDK